jgi:hypothetical protein
MEKQLPEETEDVSPIELNEEIQYYLYETAKWCKFLSIVGFVFIGLLIIGAFAAGTFISKFAAASPGAPVSAAFITVIYVLMALIYFFPTFYLYRFAVNTKAGINTGSQAEMTTAFSNLKSVFKFWGIFTLVIIIFYTIVLALAAAGGFAFINNLK